MRLGGSENDENKERLNSISHECLALLELRDRIIFFDCIFYTFYFIFYRMRLSSQVKFTYLLTLKKSGYFKTIWITLGTFLEPFKTT